MKLFAIYNVWTDTADLLIKSIENILPVVEGIIVVYSDFSYSGKLLPFPMNEMPKHEKITYHYLVGREVDKRNEGLKLANIAGADYFIIMDGDEFYRREDVLKDRAYLQGKPNLNGLVCRVNVLFGKPTVYCHDHTLVPYIHKLRPDTLCGAFKDYPFAYDQDNNAHIDPTRRLNITGIQMSDTIMWHASWIRKDIELKISTSPAQKSIRKALAEQDLMNQLNTAHDSMYCLYYRDQLRATENYFNL